MRPKKVILCIDSNETDLSVLKFMLTTNGYRALAAATAEEAIAQYGDNAVDLVLANATMSQINVNQLLSKLKILSSHVPMLLLGDPQKMDGQIHAADAMVSKKNCSPMELLERVKVMSARKRGPRKGTTRTVERTELAVAS